MARPPALRVRLAAPLGQRNLVNGLTGQPVPRFDGRLLLQPAKLPPGYQQQAVFTQLTSAQKHPVIEVQQVYWRRTTGTGYLDIDETVDSPFLVPPWQSPAGGEPWTRIEIRGVPGWASPSAIAWRQHGIIYRISASTPLPLTTAQLTAIADSAAATP